MSRRAAVLAATAAGFLVLAESPRLAEACSPPAPTPGDPCTRLTLLVPGASFPQDLHEELRVVLFEHDGYYDSQAEEFELEVLPSVARATGNGYEDVSFELVEDDSLAPHARAVRLDDPRPGDYIVSWEADDSCSSEPSPDGRGSLIGEFAITESAPIPGALGAAAWSGQEMVDKTYHRGTDAECQDVTSKAVVAHSRVEVALGDDVRPWAHTLNTSLYANGELLRGFSHIDPAAAEAGVVAYEIDHICETDDASLLDSRPNRLEEGRHEIHVVAALGLGDLARVESSTVSIEIDCGRAGDGERDGGLGGGANDTTRGGGCRAAGSGDGASALLILLAAVALARTRAAGRPKGRAAA